MRSFWSEVPLLRITVAVICGICAEMACVSFFNSPWLLYSMLVLLVLSFSLLIALGFKTLGGAKSNYRFRMVNGLGLNIGLIAFGFILTWLGTERNYPSHFQNFLSTGSVVSAKVTLPPLEKEKTTRLIAEVISVTNGTQSSPVTGHLLINMPRSPESESIKYGDILLFTSPVQELDEPKNPEEFNYKHYQAMHNIYHRAYLKKGEWRIADHNRGKRLMATVYHIRAGFLSLITKYVKGPDEFAVASAIMLGYRDYLNGDITRAFASSGTLHVLSVSGLHVGIMFMMLNFLLQVMDKRGRRFEMAKAAVIILFIWFYACLTGLSPSVMRSATMFSIIQLGMLLVRNVNMYNVIAGSALVLILSNPYIITEIGFRLSYLAVIGIIFLYPKIYPVLTIGTGKAPRFKKEGNYLLKPLVFLKHDSKWGALFVLDFLWKIVAVSLAAQIATLPISLLYFNQFPNLFWFSNLIVIPLSNLILFAGSALFALGHVPYLGAAAGWVFNLLLTALTKFIFLVNSIPYALIQGISISVAEMLLLYVAIILLCWLTEQPRVKVLMALVVIAFGLSSFYCAETVYELKQKKIVVYSVPKLRAISFIQGQQVSIDFDTALLNDESSMLYHIRHHWWACGISKEEPVQWRITPMGKLTEFAGQRILIVDSVIPANFAVSKKLHINQLILSHNPKVSLEDLSRLVNFDEVIFDSSNKPRQISLWQGECTALKIDYWNVSDKGAYIKDIAD